MTPHGASTIKRRRLIAALLTEKTEADAAAKAGVGLRTLTRWLGDPAFVAELRAAESAAIDAAVRTLAALANEAVLTLAETMREKANPPGVRVRAALGILATLLPLRDQHTNEERITALEAGLAQR